jgi:hypothetical protein
MKTWGNLIKYMAILTVCLNLLMIFIKELRPYMVFLGVPTGIVLLAIVLLLLAGRKRIKTDQSVYIHRFFSKN